jgi:hypothetical protein
MPLNIKLQTVKGGGYYQHNAESVSIQGTANPWVYTSGSTGVTRCELPLLGQDDPAASYSVTLHFAETADVPRDKRLFDIKLQGQSLAENVDIVKEAGGSHRALARSFRNISVTGNLMIELVGRSDLPPILCGIEVRRE